MSKTRRQGITWDRRSVSEHLVFFSETSFLDLRKRHFDSTIKTDGESESYKREKKVVCKRRASWTLNRRVVISKSHTAQKLCLYGHMEREREREREAFHSNDGTKTHDYKSINRCRMQRKKKVKKKASHSLAFSITITLFHIVQLFNSGVFG